MSPVIDRDTPFIKNTLLVYSAGTDDVVVKSPWISAKSAYNYMASIYMSVEDTAATLTLDLEVSTVSSGTGDTYSSNSSLRQPTTADVSDGDSLMMFQSFSTLSDTSLSCGWLSRLPVRVLIL